MMNDLRVDHISVTNHSRQLGVTVTPLRAFIDIRGADDDQSIIHDHRLQPSESAAFTKFL